MAYTLEFNRSLGIVELSYTGLFTAQESEESTARAIALGKDHGDADALVDATEVEIDVSIADLLDLPNRQYAAQGMNRRVRVAVVSPKRRQDQEAVKFYETACFNRGWNVRLFTSRDDGIEWLMRTDSPDKLHPGDGK